MLQLGAGMQQGICGRPAHRHAVDQAALICDKHRQHVLAHALLQRLRLKCIHVCLRLLCLWGGRLRKGRWKSGVGEPAEEGTQREPRAGGGTWHRLLVCSGGTWGIQPPSDARRIRSKPYQGPCAAILASSSRMLPPAHLQPTAASLRAALLRCDLMPRRNHQWGRRPPGRRTSDLRRLPAAGRACNPNGHDTIVVVSATLSSAEPLKAKV